MDRHIHLFHFHANVVGTGQEFPRKLERFFFEIIPDRKVAQHLKEGMVTRCLTHILNVIGTNGFLCIRDAFVGGFDTAIKVFLEGGYAGVDPQ